MNAKLVFFCTLFITSFTTHAWGPYYPSGGRYGYRYCPYCGYGGYGMYGSPPVVVVPYQQTPQKSPKTPTEAVGEFNWMAHPPLDPAFGLCTRVGPTGSQTVTQDQTSYSFTASIDCGRGSVQIPGGKK